MTIVIGADGGKLGGPVRAAEGIADAAVYYAGRRRQKERDAQEDRLNDEHIETEHQRRELIHRQASLADQELQREEGLRQANAQAAGVLGDAGRPQDPNAGPFGHSDTPFIGALQRAGNLTTQDHEIAGRARAVAEKMAEMGAPMEHVSAFLNEARDSHKKAVDDHARQELIAQIGNDVSSGALHSSGPGGTLVESDETKAAAQKLVDLAKNPNVPVDALKLQRFQLKQGIAADRTASKHLADTVMQLDTDIATTKQTRQALPGGPNSMSSGLLQDQTLQSLRDQFEQHAPEILRDPNSPEAAKFRTEFAQAWSNAKNGIAYVDPKLGPVSFEAQGQIQQVRQELEHWKAVAAQYDAEYKKGKRDDIPAAAADRAKIAEARKVDSERARGPASGTVSKAPSPEARQQWAREQAFKELAGVNATEVPDPAAIDARAKQILAATGTEQSSGGPKPAPDTTNLEKTRLASPELRLADYTANPQKYAGRFKDGAALKAWVEKGD